MIALKQHPPAPYPRKASTMSDNARHKAIIDRVFEFCTQNNDGAGNFTVALADIYKHVRGHIPDATDEEIRQYIELWVTEPNGISIIGENLVAEEPSLDEMLGTEPPTHH
jgi:hypothetical protein